MKHIVIRFLLCILFCSAPLIAMAHGDGHSHEPLSSSEAKLKAAEKLNQLAASGKIDASWANVKASGIEQKAPDFAMEWVVFFENKKISDPTHQTLYLFFSLDGDYITLSHDGN